MYTALHDLSKVEKLESNQFTASPVYNTEYNEQSIQAILHTSDGVAGLRPSKGNFFAHANFLTENFAQMNWLKVP